MKGYINKLKNYAFKLISEKAMRKKIQVISMMMNAVMCFIGIAICCFFCSCSDLKEDITIVINGETSKTLKAEIGNLYPGKSSEYVISLSGKAAQEYDITLKFHNDNGGVLKDYVSVEIKTENVTVNKTLRELLNGESVSLGNNISKITICYTMSENAGNETQGGDIVFFIDLHAEKIENNESYK